MKFALFYEIPVPRPWTPESEHEAYKNTIEQAVLGDQVGFHSFWTVEHHFLQEYSHCSNPEVLYGAIAARTENIRLGYGVRLMPKPYNHPVRTAESVAVLDLISKGRVDFGTGRSATRAELEGFGIDPAASRGMWQEAIGHVATGERPARPVRTGARCCRRLVRHVRLHDGCALGEESGRGGPADARRRPSHDVGPTLQSTHPSTSTFLFFGEHTRKAAQISLF